MDSVVSEIEDMSLDEYLESYRASKKKSNDTNKSITLQGDSSDINDMSFDTFMQGLRNNFESANEIENGRYFFTIVATTLS